MAEFMLLLHESTTAASEMSPEEIQAIIAKYQAWNDSLAEAGKLVGGAKLADEGGKILTGSNAAPRVIDGPYSETKEIVGGYFTVRAADYDEAVEIARGCPHLDFGGRIEIRRIDELD
ncbi:MAG: YciI family protein [Acidobacteriota bacterium]|nr:YciI family protein [Acidobacteriota bacterium]